MRRSVLLFALITASSTVALGQTNATIRNTTVPVRTFLSSPCRGEDLSLKEGDTDAAMGGMRTVDYTLTNKASSACTLYGYPSYQLFDRRGRLLRHGRAVKSNQLPGAEKSDALQLVTVEPGKEAWFRVYYNSGGAGYVGRPCPVSRTVKIIAPGTTRVFVLRDKISLCADLRVSSARVGPRE